MKDLNIISLDMEYNKPSYSIIQVGIAVGNIATGDILHTQCWNVYQNEVLSEFITKLTGIHQGHVETGDPLSTVYKDLIDIHNTYNCFRNPLTWGGGDSQDLRLAMGIDDEKFLFGRRWIDAKTLFISYCLANDLKTQSGLAKSMVRLGLQFNGRKHNAMDDAINTFTIYRELLTRMGET
jgi:inhibitor of KinA sporulation pathway (predicted exonuclease)